MIHTSIHPVTSSIVIPTNRVTIAGACNLWPVKIVIQKTIPIPMTTLVLVISVIAMWRAGKMRWSIIPTSRIVSHAIQRIAQKNISWGYAQNVMSHQTGLTCCLNIKLLRTVPLVTFLRIIITPDSAAPATVSGTGKVPSITRSAIATAVMPCHQHTTVAAAPTVTIPALGEMQSSITLVLPCVPNVTRHHHLTMLINA